MIGNYDICREGTHLYKKVSLFLIRNRQELFVDRVYKELMNQIFMCFSDDPRTFGEYIKSFPSYAFFADMPITNGQWSELEIPFKEVALAIYFRFYQDSRFPMKSHEHILINVNINCATIESTPTSR